MATTTAEQARAEAALARATAAGWSASSNGRILIGVLARRAAGVTRQLTPDEITVETARRRLALPRKAAR